MHGKGRICGSQPARVEESDLGDIYALIDKRIQWMDEKGIQQWNVLGYWEPYPKAYYVGKLQENSLYVLKRRADQKTVGAAVLIDAVEGWKSDSDIPAYYVHNFVADTDEKGAGKILLGHIQELALKDKKACLRLDCSFSNERLNRYYEQEGYALVGTCVDGNYFGNKREKLLF